jgi:Tol biopolymer transport system component
VTDLLPEASTAQLHLRETNRENRLQKKAILRWLSAAAFLVIAILVAITVRKLTASPNIQITSETPITGDGVPKRGLVTDGANIYFSEYKDGRIVLSYVPVTGGPVHEIPTPFVRALPEAISPDGERLLAVTWEGEEKDRALWVVPVNGGKPWRVGQVLCHSAVWSPDGRQIAFANGNAIFLTGNDGAAPHQLQAFAEIPRDLHWSLDGHRLLFQLRNLASSENSLWELLLSDSGDFSVASLNPLHIAGLKDCCTDASSLIDNEDSSLMATTESAGGKILLLAKQRHLWRSDFALVELTSDASAIFALERDPKVQKLYAIRSSLARYELAQFDMQSREFRPFLPGVNGLDVDFSRDDQTIAYVRMPERSLLVGKADGSVAQRINPTSLTDIELPRWSPDGKWIAFIARQHDRPWRIFLIRADGANLHEASIGSKNQGAPTWSPDSMRLVYANVRCEEDGGCSIHEIDLVTGQETTIPGSEGLTTARSSPNGQFIAALRADKHQIFLFSKETRQWRKLADGINGNDLVWAPNSACLYASRSTEGKPGIVRVSLRDGKLEPTVDLSEFSKLTGTINTWFSLAPDGSMIFLRVLATDEIYAFDYTNR